MRRQAMVPFVARSTKRRCKALCVPGNDKQIQMIGVVDGLYAITRDYMRAAGIQYILWDGRAYPLGVAPESSFWVGRYLNLYTFLSPSYMHIINSFFNSNHTVSITHTMRHSLSFRLILTASFLLILTLTDAAPTFSLAPSEPWLVPRLNMHYMMADTGLPINWPESAKFDSSIDFDINLPSGALNCQASWPNGTLPEGEWACSRSGEEKGGRRVKGTDDGVGALQWNGIAKGEVRFRMSRWWGLGERRPEMSYKLSVAEGRGNVTYAGVQYITANKNSEPTSYMTCMVGPPLDGERCKIRSYMSVDKDLIIAGERF